MTREELLKYREYHWNYFSQHADQRLKTFNFYLVFSAILIGAFVNILDDDLQSNSKCVIPFLLCFISFVFWKLDKRTKHMIKNAENAIKSIDQIFIDSNDESRVELNIFGVDDSMRFVRQKGFYKGDFSYSQSFNLIFIVFGFTGLVVGLIFV